MRTVIILAICLWVSGALSASAQSVLEKQEHQEGPEKQEQTETQACNACPSDNCSNATVTIQLPSQEQTGNPPHTPDQEANNPENAWTAWGTGIIALFTFVLAIVSWLQWRTYKATLAANEDTTRAYINASPSPPGQNSIVEVVIKNYGETPATITAIAIYHGTQLPSDPNNPGPPDPRFAGYFLVRGEHFFYRVPWPEALPMTTPYFLFGYIDYATVFKQPCRLVFARTYDPVTGQFFFVSQGGYNDDRAR